MIKQVPHQPLSPCATLLQPWPSYLPVQAPYHPVCWHASCWLLTTLSSAVPGGTRKLPGTLPNARYTSLGSCLMVSMVFILFTSTVCEWLMRLTLSGVDIGILTCACLISLFALQCDLISCSFAPALEGASTHCKLMTTHDYTVACLVCTVCSITACHECTWSMAQHITCIKRINVVLMLQRNPRLLWTSSSAMKASTAPTWQSKEQPTWLSAVPWLMHPPPFTQPYTLPLSKPLTTRNTTQSLQPRSRSSSHQQVSKRQHCKMLVHLHLLTSML